jgi:hypothetical protein
MAVDQPVQVLAVVGALGEPGVAIVAIPLHFLLLVVDMALAVAAGLAATMLALLTAHLKWGLLVRYV